MRCFARENTVVTYWTVVRERLRKFAHALAYLDERVLLTSGIVSIDMRTRQQFESMRHDPGWLERRSLERLLSEYESTLSTQLIKFGLLEEWLREWERDRPRGVPPLGPSEH